LLGHPDIDGGVILIGGDGPLRGGVYC